MITKLFNIEPQTAINKSYGPEPNLREILRIYYYEMNMFTTEECNQLAKEYIDELLFQYSQLGENDGN